MSIIQQINAFGKKLIVGERTPHKVALACSLGIFIAFSPLIGIHWLLTIIFSAVLQVNIVVVYAAAHVVNNPLTMVPLYWADYAVGLWVTSWLFGSNLAHHNPVWMHWLNVKLAGLGIPHLSLWAFLLGGHLLGIVASALAYPLLLRFFKTIIKNPESV